MNRSSNCASRSGTKRARGWTRTAAATLLLTTFSASCATIGTDDPEPGTDAVCREPNDPEIRSLTLLAHLTLPHDETGRSVELAPGEPLREGHRPPEMPELYPAASWVSGILCRCYPEKCERAKADTSPGPKAEQPGPADDPDPVSSETRGRPPGATP